MSRSYKKNPIDKDGCSGKIRKKLANRKVRNFDEEENIAYGGSYKKLYEQCNIHDFIIRWTWEEALEWYHKHPDQFKKYPSEKDFYRYWYKIMKMK